MKTSDVYLAAALLSLQFPLERINRADPRHMIFEFGNPTPTSGTLGELARLELVNVETMWANRTLTVNAFDFAEAIKRMKSLIHSGS